MCKARILITGVAGFIGSNLADRLLASPRKKYEVWGVDNLSSGIKEQVPRGVHFNRIDIRSPKLYPFFKGCDFVYHLAAKNCISDCQRSPEETAEINIQGTRNVFEAARKAKVKKVIYAESSALYEGSVVFPTPESELHPESIYAFSKLGARAVADFYRKQYGLQSTALRYFCVYGPRQDYRRTIPPVMSAFIIKLLQGEQPVIYGSGKKRRDFIHIDDINDFHLRCIEDKNTDGQTYNLGSGKSYSVREIYQKICTLLKTGIKPRYVPNLPAEAWETLADIRKAKELGWGPRVAIDLGLKSMIAYIQHESKQGTIGKKMIRSLGKRS